MTKSDLIKKVQTKLRLYNQKDIVCAVDAIFDSMVAALKKNERIEIRDFGSFTIRERKPRMGRNPKTGAQVSLKVRKVPFFKTGKDIRRTLND